MRAYLKIYFHSLWNVLRLRGNHRMCSMESWTGDIRYFCECGYGNFGYTFEDVKKLMMTNMTTIEEMAALKKDRPEKIIP